MNAEYRGPVEQALADAPGRTFRLRFRVEHVHQAGPWVTVCGRMGGQHVEATVPLDQFLRGALKDDAS